MLEKSAKAKENYHIFGTLDGVLTEKSYISVHEMRSESGECTGYLFLCSSGDRLVEFRKEFFSNFFLSACLMLLCLLYTSPRPRARQKDRMPSTA